MLWCSMPVGSLHTCQVVPNLWDQQTVGPSLQMSIKCIRAIYCIIMVILVTASLVTSADQLEHLISKFRQKPENN